MRLNRDESSTRLYNRVGRERSKRKVIKTIYSPFVDEKNWHSGTRESVGEKGDTVGLTGTYYYGTETGKRLAGTNLLLELTKSHHENQHKQVIIDVQVIR